MKGFLLIAALSLLVSACASPPTLRLSQEDKDSIGTVVIHTEVAKPPEMYFFGPGESVGGLFGILGSIVSGKESLRQAEALKQYAEENDIFIEEIVREEIRKAIEERNLFTLSDSQNTASAFIRITIDSYGFSTPHGFTSKMVPILMVTCAMYDRDEKKIWQASGKVDIFSSPAEGATMEEMKEDPRVMEEAWRLASRAIAKNIAAEF